MLILVMEGHNGGGYLFDKIGTPDYTGYGSVLVRKCQSCCKWSGVMSVDATVTKKLLYYVHNNKTKLFNMVKGGTINVRQG